MVLTTAFALSQAFRTVAAILAAPLAKEFALSAQALGVFAGAFHFAFGALQLVMGIGIDLHGVRRTLLAAFPLTVIGAVVCALAPRFEWLLVGQVLVGIGCAPAFLVCTVFIARAFPPERFAAVSGMTMGIGSVGLLLTGTPLAWVIEAYSWRAGFVVLGACSVLSWALIYLVVREPPSPPGAVAGLSVTEALRSYGALFRLPHTLGIIVLALCTYAAFLSLRGLWLGPLLIDRHGFTLVQTGNVALAVSIIGMIGPPLFGRIDPGPARRRRWILGFTLLVAALFAVNAANLGAWVDVGVALAIGLCAGYIILQYADVRSAYPAAMTGRAMAVYTMALFLGVAIMQALTGAIASAAQSQPDPYFAVLVAIAALLCVGAILYRVLPQPPQ